MPLEPLPWDRKDFFKEKKHERLDFVTSFSRWRDSHHGGGGGGGGGSRDFVRWGQDEFRRPSLGHGKQGGYPLTPEEASQHGSTPSRSSERMVEVESSFRPFTSRGDGKYGRYNRETRGSFNQRDWRGHPRETGGGGGGGGDVSLNPSGRHHHDIVVQRSVSDLITSHPHSDIENSSWGQLHLKDEYDKMGGFNGLGTGQRHDKDQSLGSIPWKPMKWNRSNSLSSRGSGFSNSSSSRSMRTDYNESKPELLPGRMTPVGSPSMEAAGGVESATFEETCSRKKQRLGWGQGLAKYEKQKVEIPGETQSENVLVACSTNTKATENSNIIPILPDRSPRAGGLSECSSPPTPTSFACSSSPGIEDKSHIKGGSKDDDDDTNNLSGSPSHTFQNSVERFSVNLEHLELTSSSNLSGLLNDLLQPEDASSGDSSFVRSTAMNRLLLLKTEFLKAVENTEFEIDSCENELKQLNSELSVRDVCTTTSKVLRVECEIKPCEVAPKIFQKPATSQLDSLNSTLVDQPLQCDGTLRDGRTEDIEDDVDSPGTATSKFVGSLSTEKIYPASDNLKHDDHFAGVVAERSTLPEGHGLPSIDQKSIVVSNSSGDVNLSININGHVSSPLSLPSNGECNLSVSILESNRDSARKAMKVFSNLLPVDHSETDIWEASRVACKQNSLLVKEKLVARKCFQRFKERVLTLKYRAFQHLWKEDLRLLSIRKYRARSQKRSESSLRISHNGYQKHRASIRSRFTSPAGNLTLVPTTDIVDFTSKVLSDSQIQLHRNGLKMPPLILDEKERKLTRFVTSNGLVEDPCLVEKERVMINPWMPSEKEVFMEMLATFGKDFKKIASFLDHKTTADCVEFYYKNHKSESFEKIKKQLDVRKQGRNFPTNTYLVTSAKKWNPEANTVSLDVLGAASVIAAQADEGMKMQQSSVGRSLLGGHYNYKPSCGDYAMHGKSSSCLGDILGSEREAVAADVLAGICGALSSEAVSSCTTSSVDPVESCQEWKFQKRNSVVDRPLTPEVMQNVDSEEACSDDSSGELDIVDWTDEEKSIFVRAFRSYGKNFDKISRCLGTRSSNQCKVFFGKARKCLGLDLTPLGSGNECRLLSDTYGGRSDTEDACVLEMESAICSTQSCTKMDVDLPSFVTSTNIESLGHATPCVHTENDRSRGNGIDQLDCEETHPRKEVPSYRSDGMKPKLVKQIERKSSATPELLQCNNEAMEDSTQSCEVAVKAHEKGGFASETEVLEDQETGQTVSRIDESVCAVGPSGLSSSTSAASVELRTTPGAYTERHTMESVRLQILVPENGYDDRQDLKDGVHIDSSRSSSGYFVPNSRTERNSPHFEEEKSVCPGFTLTPSYPHQIPLQMLPSGQIAQTISWKQKENFPSVSANLLSRDSSVIHFEDHLQQPRPSSTLNFEDSWHQKHGSSDVYQPYLLGHHSLNRVESSQILRGYPLKVLSKKELNGDANMICSERPMVQNFANAVRNSQSNQFLAQNIYHEKCGGSRPPCSLAEFPLLTKCHQQTSRDRSRSHSRSSSDTEEHSRRVGDVKLFGQILSHPSPLQKPTSAAQRTGSSKLFDLKFTDRVKAGASVSSKLDGCSYSGFEEYPQRSYGFWDGNRIQTGFSSLPESAILLSNYPAAFGDYSSASSRVEQQQPLQSVYKRKDRSLGCVSVFPTKDNRGLGEYQVYRSSYDGPSDLKRHDLISESRNRNGYEKTSSFHQQQVRGVVGMNVMGAAGSLVGGGGGGCTTSVSDPVTAIKMHYAATTERYCGQAGNMKDDPLRGGDRGR